MRTGTWVCFDCPASPRPRAAPLAHRRGSRSSGGCGAGGLHWLLHVRPCSVLLPCYQTRLHNGNEHWCLGPPPREGVEPSTTLGSGTLRHSHELLVEKAVSEAPRALQEQGVKQGPQQHLKQVQLETGTRDRNLQVHLKSLTPKTPKNRPTQARVQAQLAQKPRHRAAGPCVL